MSRDFFVRELGIELLASASTLAILRHDDLAGPLDIAPHHHKHAFQLDLIRGCRGRVFSGGRWLRFDNDIALAAYPGETHGYSLSPVAPDALVYNIKAESRNTIESLASSPIPRIGYAQDPELFRCAERVCTAIDVLGPPEPRAVVAFLSLLLAWPDRATLTDRRATGTRVHPVVEQAVSIIESNLSDPLALTDIADSVGISSRQLARLFEQSMGMTPHRYATMRRLDRAKTRLLSNRFGIGDVADSLGFSSHATFTRWFTQHTGMPPSDFRTNPRVF